MMPAISGSSSTIRIRVFPADSVTHPDILRFIHAKNDQTSLTNFNISVTVTDLFMDAVDSGTWFQTEFKDEPWTQAVALRARLVPAQLG